MLIMVGIFHAIAGLVAILDDDFYVATENYTFDLDVTAWGWLHLLVGVLMVLTGYFLFSRAPWAGAASDRDRRPERDREPSSSPTTRSGRSS